MQSALGLRRSPLLTAAIVAACGLWARAVLNPGVVDLAVVFLTLGVAAGLFLGRPRSSILLVGVPLLLGLHAGSPARSSRVAVTLPPGPIEVTARVASPMRLRRAGGFGMPDRLEVVFFVRRVELAGTPQSGRLRVVAPGDPPLGRGNHLKILGRRSADGATLRLLHPTHLVILDRGGDPRRFIDGGRRALRRRWLEHTPRAAPWLCALLLGDRGLLADGTPARFRRIGQSHLLAISGLHVGIVLSLLRWPLRRLRGPRRLGELLAAGGLVIYAGLAGGEAPVWRAVIFGVLGAAAVGGGRHRTVAQALAVAFFVMVASRGDEVRDASFLFSFAAVAGIALLGGDHRPSDPAPGRPRETLRARWTLRLSRSLRVSAGAWLGVSIPLLWWTADTVWWSPLFSLAFVPLLSVLLILGCLASVPVLGPPLCGFSLEVVIDLFRALSAACDLLPGTPGTWPPLPRAAWALGLASVAVWWRAGVGGWCILLSSLAVISALGPDALPGGRLLGVGRGQAFLLVTPRATLLLDAGSLDRLEGGARGIRVALWDAGRHRIDGIVLSHAHLDHVNAVPFLLDQISIGCVVVGPRFTEEALGRAIAATVERAGVPLLTVAAGDTVRLAELEIEVLHPPRNVLPTVPLTPNDDSLCVRIRGGGLDILAPGDLETLGLAQVDPPRAVTTLVLPHHGAFTPGLEAWLRRCRPLWAISSSGRGPARKTRALLRELHIPWFDTHLDGDLWVPASTDGRPRPDRSPR